VSTGRRRSFTNLANEFQTSFQCYLEEEVSPAVTIIEYVDQMIKCAKTHYHVGTIINSSGTGKTLLARLVTLNRRAIYVGLSFGHDGPSLLSNVAEYENMFESLLNSPEFSKEKLAAKMIYSFASAARHSSAQELNEKQFGQEATLHKSVYEKWTSLHAEGHTPTKVKAVVSGEPEDGRSRIAFDYSDQEGFDIEKIEPLVIIIDEAALLAEASVADANKKESTLRVLRRICTRFSNCFLLLLSTGSQTRTLNPSTAGSNTPSRSTEILRVKRECIAPFYRTTHDGHFADPYHPFSFGRPLWSSKFRGATVSTAFLLELLAEAARMLIGKTAGDSHLALFGVRYCLSSVGAVADNLVQNHMAIVTSIIVENSANEVNYKTTAEYYPEPILAEVACIKMAHPYPAPVIPDNAADSSEAGHPSSGLAQVLRQVEERLRFPKTADLIDIGECGEIMCAVTLSAVLDRLKAVQLKGGYDGNRLSFTQLEISAKDFFAQFANVQMSSNTTSCLDRYRLNFTHFQRRQSPELLTQEYIESLYLRACALFCRKNFEGTDILLPMKLQGVTPARYVLCAIQVKNFSAPIRKRTVASIIRKIKVEKIVSDLKQGNREGDIDVVKVLVSVGRGGACEDSWFVNPSQMDRTRRTDSPNKEGSRIDVCIDLRHSMPHDFCVDSWKIIQRLLGRAEPSRITRLDKVLLGKNNCIVQAEKKSIEELLAMIHSPHTAPQGFPTKLRERVGSANSGNDPVDQPMTPRSDVE
jgi:hypothetical protein